MTKDSKKAQGIINSWRRSNATELWQVYGTYSRAKAEAMEYCKNLQYELNGYDGRITGASNYFFSYAFKYRKDGKAWMMYITHAADITFCLE